MFPLDSYIHVTLNAKGLFLLGVYTVSHCIAAVYMALKVSSRNLPAALRHSLDNVAVFRIPTYI